MVEKWPWAQLQKTQYDYWKEKEGFQNIYGRGRL